MISKAIIIIIMKEVVRKEIVKKRASYLQIKSDSTWKGDSSMAPMG